MSNEVHVSNGIGFLGVCFILFWNWGGNSVDLYDALIQFLTKS